MTRALVPAGVPVKVELVILLGGPPLAGGDNLGDDAALPPLLVGLFGDVARDLFLVGVVEVDGAAVLGAAVGPLAVERRGVVGAVEEFEELAVGDLGGVEDYLGGLGVCLLLEQLVVFSSSPTRFPSSIRHCDERPRGGISTYVH